MSMGLTLRSRPSAPSAEPSLRFDPLLESIARIDGLDPEKERIAPLLFYRTRDPRFRKAYYDSAAANVVMLDARDEVSEALQARGVSPVLFKGADLADSLYPSPALRPMSDVDLLVAREDVEVAEHVLARLGFRPFAPEMAPGVARLTKHARLFVREDGAAVDLHWSLVGHEADTRAPKLEWFRERVVSDPQRRFSRFEPTAHLLYLAAHMTLQHYDDTPSLLWLVDFALLAQDTSVRWNELYQAADRFGWTDAVAETSREVETRLSLRVAPALPASQSTEIPAPAKGSPERALREIGSLGLAGRLALMKGYLLPAPAYIKWRYHSRRRWSWPLYYLVRWGQIARSVAGLSAKRLFAR